MIARLRRRLAARLSGPRDAGVSMTELVVTIMVTGLMAAAVSTMFYNVALATSSANTATQRNASAANVMDEVALVVRMGANNAVAGSIDPDPAIVAGTANSVTLYSLVSASPTAPAPRKIAFRLDGSGNLLEDTWTATSSGGYWVFTGTATTRTLGGPLVTPNGTDPLFVYLDSTGAVVTPGNGGLTLTQRQSIRSVRITVQIANTTSTGTTSNIVLVNTIAMTNLTTGVRSS